MSKRNFMFSICTMLFLVVLASIGLSGCYSKKEYIPQEGKVTSRTDIVQVQNEYGKYFYVSINKTKNSYTYCSKTEDGEKIETLNSSDVQLKYYTEDSFESQLIQIDNDKYVFVLPKNGVIFELYQD